MASQETMSEQIHVYKITIIIIILVTALSWHLVLCPLPCSVGLGGVPLMT